MQVQLPEAAALRMVHGGLNLGGCGLVRGERLRACRVRLHHEETPARVVPGPGRSD